MLQLVRKVSDSEQKERTAFTKDKKWSKENLQIIETWRLDSDHLSFANLLCYIELWLCTLHQFAYHNNIKYCSCQSVSFVNQHFVKVHHLPLDNLLDIHLTFQRHLICHRIFFRIAEIHEDIVSMSSKSYSAGSVNTTLATFFSPLFQFFSYFIDCTGSVILHCFIAFPNQTIKFQLCSISWFNYLLCICR